MGNSASLIGPRRRAVSGGQRVTSDNRERAGWLVNWGHGVWEGVERGEGAQGGSCTVHWCRGMLHRILFGFCFWQDMLPSKAGLGVHREVSGSAQSWNPEAGVLGTSLEGPKSDSVIYVQYVLSVYKNLLGGTQDFFHFHFSHKNEIPLKGERNGI